MKMQMILHIKISSTGNTIYKYSASTDIVMLTVAFQLQAGAA
jgi:hypothetical protein